MTADQKQKYNELAALAEKRAAVFYKRMKHGILECTMITSGFAKLMYKHKWLIHADGSMTKKKTRLL